MKAIPDVDLLEVVGCDIESRPQAPGIGELTGRALAKVRSSESLRIEFPADAAQDVQEFAAAERVCCSGIEWHVTAGEVVVLTIRAHSQALDVLEGAFYSQLNIEKHQ